VDNRWFSGIQTFCPFFSCILQEIPHRYYIFWPSLPSGLRLVILSRLVGISPEDLEELPHVEWSLFLFNFYFILFLGSGIKGVKLDVA
jgi:hypothetical protein